MRASRLNNGQDRRSLIVEKAAELFANRGIGPTTVRAIGEAAGILSGSLYHYFDSKDAIVDEILASFLDDLAARYEVVVGNGLSPVEQLRGLVHSSLACVAQYPHATEIYQNDSNLFASEPRYQYVRDGAANVRQTWLHVLEAGVADGALRADIPTWLAYHLLRDGLWLTVRWFKPSARYRTAELAEDCCSVYLDGLISEPPQPARSQGAVRKARQPQSSTVPATARPGGRRRPPLKGARTE